MLPRTLIPPLVFQSIGGLPALASSSRVNVGVRELFNVQEAVLFQALYFSLARAYRGIQILDYSRHGFISSCFFY
jgi:hypothetical protein